MDETTKATTTALPLSEAPEVHHLRDSAGRSAPIPLEQDKALREGQLPADRFDDERMRELPDQSDQSEERDRTERGNRGPNEEPGFGQGA
jgi:hypothetical protein